MGRTVDSHTVKTTMLRINIWILACLYSHYPFVFLPACPYNLMPETSQSAKVTLYRTPATTMNDLVISYQWNFVLVSGIDILQPPVWEQQSIHQNTTTVVAFLELKNNISSIKNG